MPKESQKEIHSGGNLNSNLSWGLFILLSYSRAFVSVLSYLRCSLSLSLSRITRCAFLTSRQTSPYKSSPTLHPQHNTTRVVQQANRAFVSTLGIFENTLIKHTRLHKETCRISAPALEYPTVYLTISPWSYK